MKHIVKTLSFSLLALGFSMNAIAKDSPYIIGDLQPGAHDVGFKVYHQYNQGRTFRPQYLADGSLDRSHQPRPMQIAVWYPTDAKGKKMKYGELFRLNGNREDFTTLTQEDIDDWDRGYINMWGMLGELDKDKMRENMAMDTTSIRNASPSDGKFPVVLYAQRENRGVFINFQLAEYLASHGYVVMTTSAKTKVDNAPTHNFWNQDGIESSVSDMQFIKGFAHSLPNTDMDKVGVIGYGFGSATAMGLAINDNNISAVVNWAGEAGEQGSMIEPVIDSIDYFEPQNIQTPMLQISVNPMGANEGRPFEWYEDAVYSDMHFLRFNTLDTIAFGASFVIDWVRSRKEFKSYNNFEEMDLGYDLSSEHTLKFFDTYLKNDTTARKELTQLLTVNNVQQEYAEFKHRDGFLPPPSERFFMDVFRNQGPEEAIKLYQRVINDVPGKLVFDPYNMFDLASSLIKQRKFTRAMAALELLAMSKPEEKWSHAGYAAAYAMQGDHDKSLDSYRVALESESVPKWIMNTAVSYMKQGGIESDQIPQS